MDTIRLYRHTTDGGAEYLTTVPHNLRTAVVRLDGRPELYLENVNKITPPKKQAIKSNIPHAYQWDGQHRILDRYEKCKCGELKSSHIHFSGNTEQDKKDYAKLRLEYLRTMIVKECISYGEIAELQSLSKYIDPSDTLLLQWAGVPENE